MHFFNKILKILIATKRGPTLVKRSISLTTLISSMLMICVLTNTWKLITRRKCINDEAGSLHQRIQDLVSLKPTLNVYIVVFGAY